MQVGAILIITTLIGDDNGLRVISIQLAIRPRSIGKVESTGIADEFVATPVDLDTYFQLAHATRGMKSKRAKTMSISSKKLETSIHHTRRATYNKEIDFRYTRHISAGSRGRFRALVVETECIYVYTSE
jgi:hypothetical protein